MTVTISFCGHGGIKLKKKKKRFFFLNDNSKTTESVNL